MHPIRRSLAIHRNKSEALRADWLQNAKEFLIGWTAGLIFFGTFLS